MPTLDFKGKQIIYAQHLTVPSWTLSVEVKKSLAPKGKKPALDDNLIIHGDNLHALKALMPRYAGKVNCIYIDPPYNTGNEKWIYNDNVNSPMMKEWLKGKSPVDGEDLERHDKWLCMMWPRLQLLRELLAEDGVIFISIDDNEQHRLRMVMDEIFGEENFYALISWTARNKPMNAGSARFKIQKSEEYICVYGKIPMPEHAPFFLEEKEKMEYPFTDANGKKYREEEVQQRKNIGVKRSEKMVYSVLEVSPKDGYRWTIGRQNAEQLAKSNKIFVRNNRLIRKIFKDEELDERYHPLWANFSESCGTSESGKANFDVIISGHEFETVKPVSLIRKIVFHFAKQDGVVLDSFAGSGTTAHAVLALNKEDGGNRKFILVECEKYADKITAERVRRVIKGVPKSKDDNLKNGLGGSFTYCTLGDEISIEKMLTGKNLPDYDTLARHVFYTATGQSPTKIRKQRGKDGFFYETNDRLFYLIYEPNLAFLRSTDSALNSDRTERIANQTRTKKKTALVFATHKFMGQKELTGMGIVFCGLPYTTLNH